SPLATNHSPLLRGRGYADEESQAGVPFVGDAVDNTGRRPDDFVRARCNVFLAELETADALNHIIKFVLIRMVVAGLNLARFQAVETEQQRLTLKKRRLIKFIGSAADMIKNLFY